MFIAPWLLDLSARFGRVELNIESGALDPFHPSEPRLYGEVPVVYKDATPTGVRTGAHQ
jgi:hypothetical protein